MRSHRDWVRFEQVQNTPCLGFKPAKNAIRGHDWRLIEEADTPEEKSKTYQCYDCKLVGMTGLPPLTKRPHKRRKTNPPVNGFGEQRVVASEVPVESVTYHIPVKAIIETIEINRTHLNGETTKRVFTKEEIAQDVQATLDTIKINEPTPAKPTVVIDIKMHLVGRWNKAWSRCGHSSKATQLTTDQALVTCFACKKFMRLDPA